MLLVIAKTQSDANAVSDIFNYMGVVSYGTTPECAANEISNRHRAILFVHPEKINSACDLIEIAKTYSLGSSIFAITRDPKLDASIHSHLDALIDEGELSSKILYSIISHQDEYGRARIGAYRVAGIDASVSNSEVSYFDTPLELTRSEKMILRFLIASYPVKKSAKDILKYAFRSGKLPEESSIRAHICAINAKFNSLFGIRPITSEKGVGYYVASGEAK